MPRFFVDAPAPGEYFLGGEAGRHGAKSLRLRPGEAVTLCDGRGTDYPSAVKEALPDGLLLAVGEPVANRAEPRTKITLCQCLPKSDKLETVVQKAVELGVHRVWPVSSVRCVSRWDQKGAEKKLARLQKIALEAAQQSGRGLVPQILPPTDLSAALAAAAREGDILFFYERARASLREGLGGPGDRLFLFVGPEGGFEPGEAELAASLGGRILSLGPRILRTETAPLAALAAILYEKGDWEP